ncbi:NUDIX domain-containing protein [Vibrio salinus]|uniref:NUDIX domain-containing protein n=1 Tax=Vibrio salinus TaxID=2899784 RepID=UPI001E6428CB|nr:NUDIX domain-containing protein [Vibrio salinus]MCE0495186.1 NUDIX domain-containing protein [Vibrio salinus]
MEHRIRAAGILLSESAVLLVKVKDSTGEYWIPPGGGFENGDMSTKQCLKREFREEAGINIEVGELICVREFLETSPERYNAEFFYHVNQFSGHPHTDNLKGLNDEEFIQKVEWIPFSCLTKIRTYPADIGKLVSLISDKQFSVHLGSYRQGKDEITNHL